MKFVKTFCKPGSTISPIPAGLQLKLQYNEYGLLQKIFVGFTLDLDPTYDDPDAGDYDKSNLFLKVKELVPSSINVTGGTTWVFGVLYTDNIPCVEGIVPQSLYKAYIEDIIKGGNYAFYAGYVYSLAASYNGPLINYNFLKAAGFEALPQTIVPLNATNDTLDVLMKPSTYPFRREFLAGFLVFEGLNCRYARANLMQINVANQPKLYIGQNIGGYFKGKIITELKAEYEFNYSTIVHHSISKGNTLLIEKDPECNIFDIVVTRDGLHNEKPIQNTSSSVTCPVCGKVCLIGSNDAPIRCDDPHCLSHQYTNAASMVETFKLDPLAYQKYRSLVDNKEIICITDILEIEPYKDVAIEATLAEAMRAVVPAQIVPDFSILERFANKCNHKVETVSYYLENPLRIETDLDITDPIIRRFVNWLEDPYNVSTLTTIFSRVSIKTKLEKFEGAPIFRGNTIAVTGRFKRGDYPEIKSILSSYAANVICSIELGEDLPDMVIVGSLNEEISGQMIQKAKAHNIPITDEDQFFAAYDIDTDLAQNLL